MSLDDALTRDEHVLKNQLSKAGAFLETPRGETILLGPNCPLGRSKTNQIVLTSQRASRRHALIHRQNMGNIGSSICEATTVH
jgi:pSer/pThr/pTyr-binding forkhead associated (FHA) protein